MIFLLVLKRKDLRENDGFYFSNIEQVSYGETLGALVAAGGSTGGDRQRARWRFGLEMRILQFSVPDPPSLETTGRVFKRTSSHTPPYVILIELVWESCFFKDPFYT